MLPFLLLVMSFALQVNALTTRLTVKTDTANSDSENVRYELMVDAFRTSSGTTFDGQAALPCCL